MIKLMYGRIKKSKALKYFKDLNAYNCYYGSESFYPGGTYELILVNNDDVYILEDELINLEKNLNVNLELLNYIKDNGALCVEKILKDYELKTILKNGGLKNGF